MTRRFALVASLIFLFSLVSQAQIPRTLSYQGLLTDTAGIPLADGSYSITFRLYETASGAASALWQEARTVQTKRGVFGLNLGEVTSLELSFDSQYWLGIQMAGEPELTPRMALTASGYSLHAQKSDTAEYALAAPQQAVADSARVSGTIPDNTVGTAKLEDAAVTPAKLSSGGASTGQALMFNGTNITWGTPGGGLGLPYSGSAAAGGAGQAALNITNSATSGANYGIASYSASSGGMGVYGSGNYGVFGTSSSIIGAGLYGQSTASGGIGVQGSGSSSDGWGVYGAGGAYGVAGNSESATGMGVSGRTSGTNGIGVRGLSTAISGTTFGVSGQSFSDQGTGVYGEATSATGYTQGVVGRSSSSTGVGVYGEVFGDGLNYGVLGLSHSSATNAAGVRGYAYGTGQVIGVEGVATNGTTGTGVVGRGSATGGYFETTDPNGFAAVFGSGGQNGVYGQTSSSAASGVYGRNDVLGPGVAGYCVGIGGPSGILGGFYDRGYGSADMGVIGFAGNQTGGNQIAVGVYGRANFPLSQWAGLFDGGVWVGGSFYSPDKNFRIDHPLDPLNKYLQHSCVESNERMDVYNGVVTSDANGEAIVRLPDYFEALNKDFRYQLTVIGQFAQAIVSEEVHDNQFIVSTDKPNVKVSWQVTGVRQDAYAKAHPMEVEKEKVGGERGKYLSPESFGLPPYPHSSLDALVKGAGAMGTTLSLPPVAHPEQRPASIQPPKIEERKR